MKKEKNPGFFGRIIQKIWKKIDKDDILGEKEQLAFDIFKINLYDKNNILYLNFNSNKKYIVTKSYFITKDVSTFIIFDSDINKLTIVNHTYKYDIDMPTKTCGVMTEMFNDQVDETREEMEKEILSNITQSLEIVLKQFKEKLEKSNLETTENQIV
jgi:hypothetical protein